MIPKTLLHTLACCLLLPLALLASGNAAAQLYAREAPPGSAFIRAYNNSASSGVALSIASQPQPPMAAYSASPYLFLPAGPAMVTIGGGGRQLNLQAGHYYTLVGSGSDIASYELSGGLNRVKSMIAIFNLLPDTTLGMNTVDGAIPVFAGVAPGTATQREINPLKLGVRLYEGTTALTDVPPVTLSAGKVFSLFVGGSKASPVLVWNED